MNEPKPGLWSSVDALIAVAVFVAAFAVGRVAVASFISAGNEPQYYRSEFAPAVLLACGHGFVNPTYGTASMEPGPGFEALSSFLRQQQDSLECRDLPGSFAGQPVNIFQDTHRYLMALAAGVWILTGISWPALTTLSALFAGLTAALVYLLARTGMGRALAIPIAVIWITSPVQLELLPHLRDYAKAPFFMFTLCAVAWIALTRASRGRTIAALGMIGAVLGIGFGFRTDVLSYLPFVVLSVLAFRPGFDRTDAVTRALAAATAVVAFVVAASPILWAFKSADNFAHVAMLGMTDPSRDWLALREAPYSYGYLYNDGYLATVIAGYSERLETLAGPVLLGTPDYTKWSDEYYRRLLMTFPGDMLTRAWAAVLGVFQLPFDQVNVARPSWVDPSLDAMFRYRGRLLSLLAYLPPFLAVTILAIGTSVVSLRLLGLLVVFAVAVPGMTSIQFQERHIFHLEVLPFFAYGCLLHVAWRLVRRSAWPRPALIPVILRATAVAFGLVAFVAVPVVVARAYQARTVAELFSAYESAEVERIDAPKTPQPEGQILLAASLDAAGLPAHFVDTNVLSITVGGDRCDADTVPVALRYRAIPPFSDFTRQAIIPVPPAGTELSRLVFPVYTLGARSQHRESLSFVGIEVAAVDEPCIQSLAWFKAPDKYPLLLEALLLPDWRARPLYEASRVLEPPVDDYRIANYAVPHGLRPGRRWLSQLVSEDSRTTYRSPQVKSLDDRVIEIQGRGNSSAGYLLSWPYQVRPKGSVFFVEGELFKGGLTVGIQHNERWVQQVSVDRPGRFRAALQLDEPGEYSAVLANRLLRELYARATISRYGWLPPAP